jgi:hypothetical protein
MTSPYSSVCNQPSRDKLGTSQTSAVRQGRRPHASGGTLVTVVLTIHCSDALNMGNGGVCELLEKLLVARIGRGLASQPMRDVQHRYLTFTLTS